MQMFVKCTYMLFAYKIILHKFFDQIRYNVKLVIMNLNEESEMAFLGCGQQPHKYVKFIYSEKATKFCEIFTLLLTTVHTVKS